VALGLEDLVVFNAAKLADGAIYRADQAACGKWAGTGFERPGEEIIEAGVSGDVGLGRFVHVHAITAYKPADHACGELAFAGRGKAPGQGGQRLFGQQVLRQDGKAIRHRRTPVIFTVQGRIVEPGWCLLHHPRAESLGTCS